MIGRAQTGLELTDQGAELVQGWLYDDVDGPQGLPFEVVAAPMASGSAVVADPGLWAQLQHMGMRKIAAVEMEAATVATVAHQHQVPYCLIAKGVMDHADSDKDDRYKRFAARASAEVLYALLAQLLPTAEADSSGHVPSIAPFVGIDDADIYGDGDPSTIALQRDEYGAATTAPLPEFSQVIDYLSGHRIARVSGESGTGKTTMAAMVGRDATRFDAAFYVDLASLNAPFSVTDTALLLDRLTTLDEPGRLIVVDNTHLDGRLERNIVNHWMATCGRGFMLLLSRRDEHDNRVPAVRLTVSDRSLLAVWRRTDAFAHAALALPSDGALMKWKETFPDLVTFSLAMRGSIGRLTADTTTLSQQDAVAFIRSRYLTGRSAEEEENLRRLATAGQYEFGLGPGSLVSNGLSKLVMEGLVHSRKRYYALGHPAVARLLLRALGVSTDSAALKQIAVTDLCRLRDRLAARPGRTPQRRRAATRAAGRERHPSRGHPHEVQSAQPVADDTSARRPRCRAVLGHRPPAFIGAGAPRHEGPAVSTAGRHALLGVPDAAATDCRRVQHATQAAGGTAGVHSLVLRRAGLVLAERREGRPPVRRRVEQEAARHPLQRPGRRRGREPEPGQLVRPG